MSVRPAVMIGVDTEADDQWSDEGRRNLSVRNAERLPGLQQLCGGFGARPTYLVTHEMATRDESASILRELGLTGRAEIGTHLHPWTSPPRPFRRHSGPSRWVRWPRASAWPRSTCFADSPCSASSW